MNLLIDVMTKIKLSLLIFSLLLISTGVSANLTQPLPNIVFIFADDLGWGDAGPKKLQSSPVITQNIDQLAEQGMHFTDAHTASAVCAPSRYSAMTGNNPFRGRKRWGTWDYFAPSQILESQNTVADVLKAAGYQTAFFGKWHMGGDFFMKGSNTIYRGDDPTQVDFNRRFHNGPLDHGFDYSYTLPSGIQAEPYAYFENDRYTPIDPANAALTELSNGPFTRAGYGDPNWDSRMVGGRLAQKAVDFINRHNNQYGNSKPFLLYYATQAPHGPYTPPAQFDGKPVAGETGMTARQDMILELDFQVGKIINAIDNHGLSNNTLIIFTSDNGGYQPTPDITAAGHDGVAGLRGQKAEVYDGGHRVPFIAKWGDGTPAGSKIKPGSVNHQLISVNDWVATMYALTNQALPEDQALDSANILPLLTGEKDEPVRSYLMVDATPGTAGTQRKWRTIRAGDWALLLDPSDTPQELYNMATDHRQTRNLINDSQYNERVNALLDQYLYAINVSTRTVPDPCGKPNPGPVQGPAIHLWKDCGNSGQWHLHATGVSGAKDPVVFEGELNSDGHFTDVVPYKTSPHDSIYDFINTSDPKRIEYGFKIWDRWVNGVDFTIADNQQTCFSTLSQPTQTKLLLGGAQLPFTTPFDLNSLMSCRPSAQSVCGEPAYNPAKDHGIFLWKDCPNNQWHLRVTAGMSNGAMYQGFTTTSNGNGLVTPYNLNANDTLDVTTQPSRIDFDIRVWQPNINGFDFSYPQATDLCFGLSHRSGNSVTLGQSKVSVKLPINLTTLEPCVL